MLKAATTMFMKPSHWSIAPTGVSSWPVAYQMPNKATPMRALLNGPTKAIRNSWEALSDSRAIWETPPSANSVMLRTGMP